MKPTHLRPVVLALAVGALLPACLMNSETQVENRGRTVGDQTMQQITPGKSKEYVLAVLGEPSSRKSFDEGMEIWTWNSTTVERSQSGLIFVFASKRSVETQQSVYVEFSDDLVTRSWRD